MEYDQLFIDVKRFRSAIEDYKNSDFSANDSNFKNSFPSGQCQNSSLLLAAWLRSEDYLNVEVVSGDNSFGGNADTHAWVCVGEVVVDITADQFDERKYPSVWVGEKLDLHSNYVVRTSFQQSIDAPLFNTYRNITKFIK